jgi:M6 family metalloprotease-like protein
MRKHIGFILLLFIDVFTINHSAYGVIAYPYPVEITQANGIKITIILKGDEHVKWAQTVDGYSIMRNSKGIYEYATLDSKNEMFPSGILVRNQSERSSSDNTFLANTKKGLVYSKSQVGMMKSISKMYSDSYEKAFPPTGNRKLICILIGFQDKPFTKTQAEFDNLMNQVGYITGGATGSVKDFYNENSYNQFDLTITVAGPFTAANNLAYYGANNAEGKDTNARELVTEAVTLADPTVNFADFDNDGDGTVDGVYVIYAGYGEEAGGSADCIWAHAWNIPTVTKDGKTISRYSCSPELRGNNGTTITAIGVICHEFGHIIGAMDFYDTNYSTDGQYNGTGYWDLMASGSWNNNGITPAHHNAYTKIAYYGWTTATTITSGTTLTLSNAEQNSNSFYRINTDTPNEYFLIENRQQHKFDSYIPGHGMVIYHVDENYISTAGNSINAGSHQGMYPVCANATGNPPTNYGAINSAGCPFPGNGSINSFTDATTPNSLSWAGTNTARPITAISENSTDKTVSFTFMGGIPCAPPIIQATTFASSSLADNSMTISWTRGNGNAVLVVARSGSAVNEIPSNGIVYSANTAFGNGSKIGSGNYVVYNGTGNSVNLTNLNSGTGYYYAIYEYSSTSNCYLTPALIGNAMTTGICTPIGSNYGCGSMWITNVTTSGGVSDFNNSSACASSSYTDYSGSITSSNSQLSTTTISFTSIGSAMSFSVWIDYNDNDILEASERVIANNNTGRALTFSDNFTVPISALPGTHKMRVRGDYYYYGAPSDPCNRVSGETEDYAFRVIAAIPCTGIPDPGNTLSTVSAVCSGENFKLSLQNPTSTIGITYRWQSSTNNLSWSDIPNAINTTLNISQSAPTYYRCLVTCSAGPSTGISNSTFVVMKEFSLCYCPSMAIASEYEEILNVTVGKLNNTSDCNTTGGAGSILKRYSDFTSTVTASNISPGGSYQFSIEIGTCGGLFVSGSATAIFIDYNQNGSFEDAGEKVYFTSKNTAGPHFVNGSFIVPNTALLGKTRMRVINRILSDGISISSCSTYSYGETEDYLINVVEPCISPTIQATTFISSALADTSMTISWTRGNGNAVLVVARNEGSVNEIPSSDVYYEANPAFGSGAIIGTGNYVVYNGTGTSVIITNLTSGSGYYYSIFEYNSTTNCYLTPALIGNASTTGICAPPVSNMACGSMWITNVTTSGGVSDFNNSSACSSLSYTDYSGSIIASNSQLETTTMSFTSTGYLFSFSVWIDFNGNKIFEASERVIANKNSGQALTFSDNFTVPISAIPGTHRMRVRGDYYLSVTPSDPCKRLVYGETEDYAFTVIPAIPCAGTPNPGNTLSTVLAACPEVNFTLRLQNSVSSIGTTYQWQSSTDNINYTNISGATNSTCTTTQTVLTYYRCIVTCSNSGLSYYSTSLNVTMNPPTNCYCTSRAIVPLYEEIINVTVGSLNNTSDCNATGGAGSILNQYSDYTTTLAAPNLDQRVTFSIKIGACGGYGNSGTAIFIDYNKNGSFADAGERAYGTPGQSQGPHFVTGGFSIPSNALLGNTRMRVINMKDSPGISIESCFPYPYGETEDYMVNIVATCTPPAAPTIETITQPTCTVATGSVILSGLPASGTWTLTRTPGGTTTSGTGTSTAISGLAAGTYTYTVTNESLCTSVASANIVINAKPKPATPIITFNGNFLHSSSTNGNQWYNQSGLIYGAIDQDYTVLSNGDYYVIVTLGGCSSEPSNSINVVLTEINEFVVNSKVFKIYPNHVSNELLIEVEGGIDKTGFEILNSTGQIVYKGTLFEKMVVQTADFSSGIYIIKFENGKAFEFRKIVKKEPFNF